MKLKTALLMINFLLPQILFSQVNDPHLDGVDATISEQMEMEMSAWARNTYEDLQDALSQAETVTPNAKLIILERGIWGAVQNSNDDRQELLMRIALNRAIIISEILDAEVPDPSDRFGRVMVDFKIRLYLHSIDLAMDYYRADMVSTQGIEDVSQRDNTLIPRARFGVQYANKLIRLARSVMDASAQYHMLYQALRFLRSDISQDANAEVYARDFQRIRNGLERNCLGRYVNSDCEVRSNIQDIDYIRATRNLKRVIETLNLHDGDGGLDYSDIPSLAELIARRRDQAQ